MHRFAIAFAAACLVGVLPATAADAAFLEVREAVNGTLAPVLKEKGLKKVSFDWILTSTKVKVPGSAGICNAFEACLDKHGIAIVPGQAAMIAVVVSAVDCDPETDLPATRLTITLAIDGKQICESVRDIHPPGDIAVIESLQFTIPPNATKKEIVKIVELARGDTGEPGPGPRQTKKFSNDKAIAVEMIVGQAISKEEDFVGEARMLDSHCRVAVKDGESYRLRITSTLAYPIAVSINIDGLDWAHFFGQDAKKVEVKKDDDEKEAQPKPRLFVMVPAKGTVLVKGWAKSLEKSLAFDVARLPIAASGRQADVGVVQIRYAACWDKGGAGPADEPKEGSDLASHETATGIEIGDKKKHVEQVVGKVRGAIKLTYGEFK